MEISDDPCDKEVNGEENERIDSLPSTSTNSSYKLFGRQSTVHQMMGGGKGTIFSFLQIEFCFEVSVKFIDSVYI